MRRLNARWNASTVGVESCGAYRGQATSRPRRKKSSAKRSRKRLRRPGVEEDHDLARGAPTAQVPALGHRTLPVEDPHTCEPLGHGDRAVARAGVDHDHLLRPPRLAFYIPEQVPEVTLLFERRYDEAQ